MKNAILLTLSLFQLLHISVCASIIGNVDHFKSSTPLHHLTDDGSVTTTECGGVLKASTGEIKYSIYEPFQPNELCTWIIRGGNVTGYHVAVFHLGFPAIYSEQQLTISCFAHELNTTYVVANHTGMYNMDRCSVLMLTFHSGENNPFGYNGFELEYSGYNSASIQVPISTSKDITFPSDNLGYLKYPSTTSYLSMELSTIFFLQTNRTRDPTEQLNVVFMMNGLYSDCKDSVKVYMFNRKLPELWEHSLTLCHSNKTAIFSNDDAILLVFESDRTSTDSGFHVAYSRCSKLEIDDEEDNLTTTEGQYTTTDNILISN